jgi:hypothetical protein
MRPFLFIVQFYPIQAVALRFLINVWIIIATRIIKNNPPTAASTMRHVWCWSIPLKRLFTQMAIKPKDVMKGITSFLLMSFSILLMAVYYCRICGGRFMFRQHSVVNTPLPLRRPTRPHSRGELRSLAGFTDVCY